MESLDNAKDSIFDIQKVIGKVENNTIVYLLQIDSSNCLSKVIFYPQILFLSKKLEM